MTLGPLFVLFHYKGALSKLKVIRHEFFGEKSAKMVLLKCYFGNARWAYDLDAHNNISQSKIFWL